MSRIWSRLAVRVREEWDGAEDAADRAGAVRIDTPRDRAGTFEPQIIRLSRPAEIDPSSPIEI
jgi:hypothetical protein